jgi:hypothetical protein
MSDQQGFFGDIFDTPEDDPLLQSEDGSDAEPDGDEPSPADRTPDESVGSESGDEPTSPDAPMPAWDQDLSMDERDENPASETFGDGSSERAVPTEQERVVLSPGSSEASRGIRTLNDACNDGWRIVRLRLSDPDGRHDSKVIVTIERDIPPSLFDFGGTDS